MVQEAHFFTPVNLSINAFRFFCRYFLKKIAENDKCESTSDFKRKMRAFIILILFKYNDRIAWAICFKFLFSCSSKLRFRSVWIPRYLQRFCVAVTISAEIFACNFNQMTRSFFLLYCYCFLPTLWTHTDAGLSHKFDLHLRTIYKLEAD